MAARGWLARRLYEVFNSLLLCLKERRWAATGFEERGGKLVLQTGIACWYCRQLLRFKPRKQQNRIPGLSHHLAECSRRRAPAAVLAAADQKELAEFEFRMLRPGAPGYQGVDTLLDVSLRYGLVT